MLYVSYPNTPGHAQTCLHRSGFEDGIAVVDRHVQPCSDATGQRLTFTHFAEYLVCSINTTLASKPCGCRALWKQMMADTYILKSSSPQAETHNVPPVTQTQKLRR